VDFKLELIPVPVTDVDRAKDFYVRVGFNADHDHRVSDELRFVQLTPPGSASVTPEPSAIEHAEPGSVQGMQLVVGDIDAARTDLEGRGVGVSPVVEYPWGKFAWFHDPDGNSWSVQQPAARG